MLGAALGSAMVFFGLYSLLYDLNTGLLFSLSAGELFGKLVFLYNVIAGFVFMAWGFSGFDGESHPAPRAPVT